MITYLPIAQQLATCTAGRQRHNVFSSSTFRRRQVAAQLASNPARASLQAEAKSRKQQTLTQTRKAAKPKLARASAAAEPEIMDVQGQEVDTRIPVTVRLQPVSFLLHLSAKAGSALLLVCNADTYVDLCRLSPASLDLGRQHY